jgi:hypothetical protein
MEVYYEEVIRSEEPKSEETGEAKLDEVKMNLEPLSQSTRSARPRLRSLT